MQYNSFYLKYKYIKKLGHGGCGDVFLAENLLLGNLWAVKEITKGEKTSVSGYIEPEILKRLNHPALPRICDVYEDESKIYIVEDYLEGTNLKHELDAKGKFTEQRVIDWAIQLCNVLEYLHCQEPNPIIYGDMKPQNIILTKEGYVKLVDFGVSVFLSKRQDESAYNGETTFIGTKGYAAPEQFMGSGISCTSDIYSLGITLIQLLTGLDPIKPQTVFQEKYAEYLTPGFFEILQKCIEPRPERRYQTAGLLMKELRQYSLLNYSDSEQKGNCQNRLFILPRIIAITGCRGTGMSTIAAALAEHASKGQGKACIVDLSESSGLAGSLLGDFTGINEVNLHSAKTIKINAGYYYTNLSSLIKEPQLIFHNQLSQIIDSFSYIFIDVDITVIKYIEQYLNQIYIVSDMNPGSMSQMVKCLEKDEMSSKLTSRTFFIINKFYKGELSSKKILKSILLKEEVSERLQDLIVSAKVFEVPYDKKIYFGWMYSYFGERLKFKNIFTDDFDKAILRIVSNVNFPQKRRNFKIY